MPQYYTPQGGLPPQKNFKGDKSHFTPSYAVIDKAALTDITASLLPHWNKTRLWVLARPMTGFSETFSHYIMEVAPGGGATNPDPEPQVESVLFMTQGHARLDLDAHRYDLSPGSYVFISPKATPKPSWKLTNTSTENACFHWLRKKYVPAQGIDWPQSFVSHDEAIPPTPMPDTNGAWATTRFVESDDLSHDMHVNIVTFQPGGGIPFAETHVMEHGLYMLQGTADYYINQDWVEVAAGDYLWLRAFSPQACIAKGNEPFRYLLYKDVNRHMPLTLGEKLGGTAQ